MKFSAMEIQILKQIDDAFPIPLDPSKKEIIAIGERPLLSVDEIVIRFGEKKRDQCIDAIHRLITFQCIGKVHLLRPQIDFSEVQLAAGQTVRLPYAKQSSGHDALQITGRGQDILSQRPWSRIKQYIRKWIDKALENQVSCAIGSVIIILLSLIFGRVLNNLPKLNNTEKMQNSANEPILNSESPASIR